MYSHPDYSIAAYNVHERIVAAISKCFRTTMFFPVLFLVRCHKPKMKMVSCVFATRLSHRGIQRSRKNSHEPIWKWRRVYSHPDYSIAAYNGHESIVTNHTNPKRKWRRVYSEPDYQFVSELEGKCANSKKNKIEFWENFVLLRAILVMWREDFSCGDGKMLKDTMLKSM